MCVGDLGSGKSLLKHWLTRLLPADSLTVDLFDETAELPWRHGRTQNLDISLSTLKLTERVTHYLCYDYPGRGYLRQPYESYLGMYPNESVVVVVLPLFDKARNLPNSRKKLGQR